MILSGNIVISNDALCQPYRALSAGDVPLEAFLGVPIFKGHEVVGLRLRRRPPGNETSRRGALFAKAISILGIARKPLSAANPQIACFDRLRFAQIISAAALTFPLPNEMIAGQGLGGCAVTGFAGALDLSGNRMGTSFLSDREMVNSKCDRKR